MIPQDEKICELVVSIAEVSSEIADFWQVTAIIESLGYTDRVIRQEFGFADALSLGKHIYEHYQLSPKPKSKPKQKMLGGIYFMKYKYLLINSLKVLFTLYLCC